MDTTAGAKDFKTLKKPEIKAAIKVEVDHAIANTQTLLNFCPKWPEVTYRIPR